ncbi:hypothetical protein VF11_37505 [Nostoc linckia z14]|nr:hypothetical protein VF11_37505 [Nostoc linckia z14]
MKKALFLMLPTPSHYTPCFGLANDLRDRGFTIVFGGTPSVADLVVRNGFDFVPFTYMPTYEVTTLTSFLGTFLKSATDPGFLRARYREFVQGIAAAHKLYQSQQPDVIYLDEHLNHYYAYFKSFTSSIYLINTKLSTRRAAHVPPLNSGYVASGGWGSSWYCKYLWIRQFLTKTIRQTVNAVAFAGRTDDYFQHRLSKRLGVAVRSSRQSAMYCYDALPGVKTLILMDDTFEYPWIRHSADERVLHYWNQDAQPIDDTTKAILAQKRPNVPLIYCGIGTLAGNDAAQYTQFIHQLLKALGGLPTYQVVISTGRSLASDAFDPAAIPANIQVVSYLNQQAILPHCALMITHGGLNSIKECMAATVPMLGIDNPADIHKDTPGNIARIVYHKIGLRCQISDPASVIRLRVDQLLADDTFKTRISQLKATIDSQQQVRSPVQADLY